VGAGKVKGQCECIVCNQRLIASSDFGFIALASLTSIIPIQFHSTLVSCKLRIQLLIKNWQREGDLLGSTSNLSVEILSGANCTRIGMS